MSADDQYVPRGSYAISTVRLAGAKADGTPVAMIRSAICDVCDSWATHVWQSGQTTTAGGESILNDRVRRNITVTVFACQEHREQVSDALVDEYGHATNRYEPNELAAKVSEADRAWMQSENTMGTA